MFLLLHALFMSLNILMINCDQTCDCQEIKILKEIVQQVMLEQRMESAKLRTLEAKQRSAPADRLSKMEAKVKDIDEKLNHLEKEKLDGKHETLATALKKTLTAEKLERIHFSSSMERQMTEVKNNFHSFKRETTNRIDEHAENIIATQNDFKRDVNEKVEDIKEQTYRSISQSVIDAISSQTQFKLRMDEKLENMKDHRVAFTANGVTEDVVSGQLRFPNIMENFGDGYSKITGKFTCNVPGIYHFVVTLSIRDDTHHKVLNCHIYVNSERKMQMYAKKHTHDSKNSYPATVAGTLHLNRGDTVYVGDCGEYSSIYNDISTIFTGFLVFEDK